MQANICEVCLKSDILCNADQAKLDNNLISQMEIDISRFLYKMTEKIISLRDVKISKILDTGVILIVCRIGDAPKLVGKNGYVVKALAKKFKKSIRVLEEASTFEKFIENLVFPAQIAGINTLYTPEKEIYKIRVPTIQKNKLMISPENFSSLVENLFNKKVEIIFD